ncbi:putative mrna-binding post-transcriptional regulator [Diaporthe ampelina]|uniref:Putative mrna-binding post-transcriptional regulator n=1 Tax=Diaporthe ampelina TaxID=1214573 RepID=A0A0G2HJU0_9PEZI|nr:putative mrna-binding post-transcriptional regulator [Diaporthe ampelina]
MSFPQSNNGVPDGSTPINGGALLAAPAMQGSPAGQNTANESARTLRTEESNSWTDEQFIKSLYQNQAGDNVNVKNILCV